MLLSMRNPQCSYNSRSTVKIRAVAIDMMPKYPFRNNRVARSGTRTHTDANVRRMGRAVMYPATVRSSFNPCHTTPNKSFHEHPAARSEYRSRNNGFCNAIQQTEMAKTTARKRSFISGFRASVRFRASACLPMFFMDAISIECRFWTGE